MSGNTPFFPMGLSAAVDSNATPATASAATLTATALGLPFIPNQVRIANTTANIIYVSLSTITRVAIAPIPGTPQQEWCMLPGTVEVFTTPQDVMGKQSCFVNTIAAVGASNRLILTFGEGL